MKIIWQSIKLMMASVLLVVCFLTFKGYTEYRNALESKPLDVAVEEIVDNPSFVSISEVPEIYKRALLAVEDKRFYKHLGIDILAIGRAAINDLKAMAFVEGGSTITQQLAKNMFFSQDKNICRKIAEAFMALTIEKKYSKDQILDLYINKIYYGDGYYTLRDASEGYFGKHPKDLTEDECTLLVGIPNAPSVYSPTNSMEMARQRQQQVIKILEKEYGQLEKRPLLAEIIQ